MTFTDAQGNPIKHQNYAISVTQDRNEIFSNTAGHTHTGNDMQSTNNLASSNPVDIKITLNGIGLPGTDPSTWTGPKGEALLFHGTAQNVVPTSVSPETTVTTDKTSYTSGDIIHFSGTTVHGDSQNVYIAIYDPNNSLVLLSYGATDNNHNFQIAVDTGNQDNKPKFSLKGIYNATAFITNKAAGKTTSFVFSPNGSPVVPSPTPPITQPITPAPTPVPQPNENTPITITVSTDKTVYDHNSIIMVSGHVRNSLGQDVGMKVISPSGNVVSAAQLIVNSNGDYTTKLNTTNSLWTENGVYTIYVQQGNIQDRTSKVQVEITGELPGTTTPTIPTTILNATTQDLASINDARNNQTIAAEVNVVNQTVQTTSINSNVSVQTNNTSPDSLSISVSASSQTGPKVLVVNLAATTIDIANLKDLGVMYDGEPILPASNIDSILHAKNTDSPSFAIVITQSGAQILILIPHFSTHTITITNMTKVIPAVPEFGSLSGMIIITSMIGVLTISRKFRFHF